MSNIQHMVKQKVGAMDHKGLGSAALKTAYALLALVPALSWAGYPEGMDALAVRDYARARAEFELDRTEARAVFELARMARLGWGEPVNESRSTALLQTAAEMGHPVARMEYAYAVGNGRGVEKDPVRALQMFEKMSAEGRTDAQVVLGRALRFGWWGQPKDETRAAELFKKAMDAGDINGRLQYASALINGLGVAKDEAQGAELLRPSVDNGHLDSQLEYARLLSFGIGVSKDEAAGTAMYRRVAEGNNSRVAQYAVGVAYLRARGVPRDEKAAARWMDAAARQGWEWAQLELADMFRQGLGVPKSRNEAYYWYSVASRGGNQAVSTRANTQRTSLARDMTEANLSRLSARAEAFKPQPGLRVRQTALPPLARGDQVSYGDVSMKIPAPTGYNNGWEMAEWIQQAYPNDPAQGPLLMVLQNQEDVDRIKLGLRSGVRRIEVSRHFSDDSITATPKLFGEIKEQLRSRMDTAIAGGRYKAETEVQNDDIAFSFVRSSVTEPNRFDALAYVLVKEKVLLLSFSGFTREQGEELAALVRSLSGEISSANRASFFTQ